ncbi:hypothetical protein PY254_15260 [Rhodanobacter sp. AS-Z3]|uniref:hypothetical protein n=1 Tax=Rhodanobacter sp. AS-Z3 TaxID=3031330 RepID=UPI00247A76E6|nr:hypothetical protein [Rhodanobacter sp. AS-Z3]WEN14572.1 hypothetical protein PY254_15260 [Rhodanobacter sp. AS-Z3]
MKTLLFSCVLLLAPVAVHAECTAKDFAITDFKPAAGAAAGGRMAMPGNLVNNCATASAAQIRIEVKDASGSVVQSKQVWPAGTSNLEPGKSTHFDLGRLFRYQPGMASFTASVVDVRTW